jgi:uncharacterized membrane protein
MRLVFRVILFVSAVAGLFFVGWFVHYLLSVVGGLLG